MNQLAPMSTDQYLTVMNVFSLSVALFAGFAALFILLRRNVAPAYSIAVSMMAAIMIMAGYHYFRIYSNWGVSFALRGGEFVPTGYPFSYAYRYADWLGTVPLLVTASILVLDLGRDKSTSLVSRLSVSAVLMVLLGYLGEGEYSNMAVRATWGAAASLPFGYILFILWGEMTQVLHFESARVRVLFSGLRFMLLASWGFYPVVYMLPLFGLGGPEHTALIQIGNSAADLLAKIGVGLMILAIAREKTEEDIAAEREQTAPRPAAD
jgi:bacteriorhodopsin